MDEAERLGITRACLEMRLSRGLIAYPPLERINARVINVLLPAAPAVTHFARHGRPPRTYALAALCFLLSAFCFSA